MLADLHRIIMQFNNLGFLIVFAVVRLQYAQVPSLSGVKIKCDSYGVVVEWTATGLSQEAEFELEIKPNFGQIIPVFTKDTHYNISALLKDPTHNLYLVKVKVKDGEQESEFVKSESFTFDTLIKANITCGLMFPPVTLFPEKGMLFVQFANPLYLYSKTPALRNLTSSDTLLYCFNCDKQQFGEELHMDLMLSQEFICDVKSQTCKQNISFPNEQKEYCVTLTGKVRHTIIRQTYPSCYSGPLYPEATRETPTLFHLIPLLIASVAFAIFALVSVFLWKKINKIIKKKHLSKLPKCLNGMSFTPLITPLKPEQALVSMNPRVELDIKLSLDNTHDLQELTAQAEVAHSANSSDPAVCTVDKDMCERSESGEYQGSWNTYGNKADFSSSNFSESYDCSHWSPSNVH